MNEQAVLHYGYTREEFLSMTITVSDTGQGIAPTDRPKIFHSFFTTKKQRGMGLGLSICESILRVHAAKLLSISRSTLYEKLKRYHLLDEISGDVPLLPCARGAS
jgi:signal transduction histidine kinase